jgi:hypothetical protein
LPDVKSTHKNQLCFSYTNNEQSQEETKKTIPFTKALKRKKYLGINITKKAKNLKLY